MRNLKKILALVLALMMVLSVMVTASAVEFEDADSINPAYEQAVQVMAEAGILKGTGNGFEPTKTLDRASAAKLIAYLALNTGIEGIIPCETIFDDVTASHWASGYIAYCYDAGIVNGNSATTYNPAGNITVESYAKLLLGVLGIEGTYTGDKWYVAVRNNSIKTGLMTGMTGYAWTADITREEAAQMTFNAMKAGSEATSVAAHYEVNGIDFTSAAEAYFYAQGQDPVATVNYVKGSTTYTGLMAEFGITMTTSAQGGKDDEGRPALVYTIKGEKEDTVLAYAETPVDVYTSSMNAAEIAVVVKALTDAKYNTTAKIPYYVDGVGGYSNTGLANVLTYQNGDNTVIELYADADKNLSAVVTNTYIEAAGKITEADAEKKTPETIKINGEDIENTLGLIEGEYVTYTKINGKINVETLAKADYVVGTLSSYNSKGEYTINGEVYTLDGVSASTVQGQFGKAYVYYLGSNGTIIATAEKLPSDEDPATPVAPAVDGYAIVTDVAVVIDAETTTGKDIWTGETTTTTVVNSVSVLVKTLTDDADVAAYSLPVKQAAKDNKLGLAAGDYYVEYLDKVQYICDKNGQNAKTNENIESVLGANNTIYTYAVADGAIDLVGTLTLMNGTENKDGEAYRSTPATIGKSTLYVTYSSGQTVLFNENTIFVLKDTDTKNNTDPSDDVVTYVVKTGVAALEATDDLNYANGAKIIMNVSTTKDKDGNVDTAKNVYTAKVVFAQNVEFDKASGAPAIDTEEYVYVDASSYVVTKAEDGKTDVYTYVAKKVDGSAVSVTYNKALASTASGIYVLKTDGSLGTAKDTGVATTVGAISGTTVLLDSYVIVNSTTTVVGELATGAQVYYVMGENNVVDTIYVVKAAQ